MSTRRASAPKKRSLPLLPLLGALDIRAAPQSLLPTVFPELPDEGKEDEYESPPGEGYDPRDSRALAVKNPTMLDRVVRFGDEKHTYAIRISLKRWMENVFDERGRMVVQNVVSVTGLLKYAFTEADDDEWDMMARRQYKTVVETMETYRGKIREFVPDLNARLATRPAPVRDHVRADGPHTEMLAHLAITRPEKSYDELLLYLAERNLVRKLHAHETVPEKGKWYEVPSEWSVAHHVRTYWASTSEDGTSMHAEIEAFLNGQERAEAHSQDFDKFFRWFQTQPFGEPWRTEINVCYPMLRVAGAIDGVFRNPKTKRLAVLDWKRVKDMELQRGSNKRGWFFNAAPDRMRYEIVENWKEHAGAKPYGNSKLQKYLIQTMLYAEQLEASGVGEVDTVVVVQMDPINGEARHYARYKGTPEWEGIKKACAAIWNARRDSIIY